MQILRGVLETVCLQTLTNKLAVKWVRKRLFSSIPARPATARRGDF
jgi:hypothetical protein